jgi:hemerythrin
MDPIIWNDEKLSVGHEQIDNQHKELIRHLNNLIALQKEPFDPERQYAILADLEKYVEKHLYYEEALLRKQGYPALEDHEMLHSQYMMELEMWASMLEDEDPELPKRMCGFIQTWLVEHIMGEDMKFKPYVKS